MALLQLVAYGAQDVFLTGNPEITFWRIGDTNVNHISSNRETTFLNRVYTNVSNGINNVMNNITGRRNTSTEINTNITNINRYNIQKNHTEYCYTIKFKYINRKIDIKKDKNIECPIRLSKIFKNERYGQCETCHYNISRKCLLKALNVKRDCPMCRSKWTNKIMFKNK